MPNPPPDCRISALRMSHRGDLAPEPRRPITDVLSFDGHGRGDQSNAARHAPLMSPNTGPSRLRRPMIARVPSWIGKANA